MPYAAGDTLDRRYVLKRLIARSDHAELFEAEHAHLRRTVAVRVLSAAADARERAALLREARLLEQARHRCVLGVVDVAETPEREPYLVTEALAGRPLDGVLAVRGALAADEAVAIVLDVADALGHAHSLGVAHAGLAPASVMLVTTSSALRTGSFAHPAPGATAAVAKLLDLGAAPGPTSAVAGPLAAMGYASPERLAGGEPDASNDAHALGALLYELLTGELPEGPALGAVPAPASVAGVIERALAPRGERYASAVELAAALRDAIAAQALPKSLPPPTRRAHPRAGYVTPVRVRRPGGDASDGRTEDISEGGLLVLIGAEIDPGESVLVRFALPTSGRMVSVPAEVKWARESRGAGRALGLAFLDPGDKVVEDVRAYVAYLGE